jgi:YbgC/YbaW family acyl-CoA thioester hydrolase
MYIYQETVEFEDVDSYNIAHHTKIIAYLERARVHFFIDNGIDILSLEYGPVITKLNIQFKLPLIMLEKINILVKIIKLDKIRFEWKYTIKKEDKTAVIATMEQVLINKANKKLIPIPEEIKKILKTIKIN